MIPELMGRKFETVPLSNPSDDVEKGLETKAIIPAAKHPSAVVTVSSGVSWRQWILMAMVTFLIWFLLFSLFGPPVVRTSCFSSPLALKPGVAMNNPATLNSRTTETRTFYFGIFGPQDETPEDPASSAAAKEEEETNPGNSWKNMFSNDETNLWGSLGQDQERTSDENDGWAKVLAMSPGWHGNQQDGVYVGKPISIPILTPTSDEEAVQENNVDSENKFASLLTGITAGDDSLEAENLNEQEQEKVVQAFLDDILQQMNASLNGQAQSQPELTSADQSSEVDTKLDTSIVNKLFPPSISVNVQPQKQSGQGSVMVIDLSMLASILGDNSEEEDQKVDTAIQSSAEVNKEVETLSQKIDSDLVMSMLTPSEPIYVSPKLDKRNWFEALQACWERNMQLVAIQDAKENQEILSYINNSLEKGEDADFWTAGTNLWVADRSEFHWATTGEKFSYQNWHHGNPSSPNVENQNCVQLTKSLDSPTQGSYLWNDYGCHYRTRFICEDPLRNLSTLSSSVN